MLEKKVPRLIQSTQDKEAYQIIKVIFENQKTRIYLAERIKDKKKVTLKRVYVTEAENKERFEREIIANRILQNTEKYFIKCIDIAKGGEVGYLIMEYKKGIDLQLLLSLLNEFIEVELAARIIYDITQALIIIEQKNMLQRDIKKSNILITEDFACLIDFSIATSPDWPQGPTAFNATPGSTPYLPKDYSCNIPREYTPEIIQKFRKQAEIFALGCTFYYTLLDKMFDENEKIQTKNYGWWLWKKTGIIPPNEFRKDIPLQINQLILRMLTPIEQENFPDVKEVNSELKNYLNDKAETTLSSYEQIKKILPNVE